MVGIEAGVKAWQGEAQQSERTMVRENQSWVGGRGKAEHLKCRNIPNGHVSAPRLAGRLPSAHPKRRFRWDSFFLFLPFLLTGVYRGYLSLPDREGLCSFQIQAQTKRCFVLCKASQLHNSRTSLGKPRRPGPGG
jgi:hypothetical protein